MPLSCPRANRLPFLCATLAGTIAASCAIAATPAPGTDATAEAADWRDAVIYFVMIDRFDDGDPSNNDQGANEFDPKDARKFSGGDLRGVRRRLDYIEGLGATAIWITPPVANRWWSDAAQFGGYHGYWTKDFDSIDAHFGSLSEYRALSDAIHAREMRLIQDVVVNHVADYHGWRGDYDSENPQHGFELRPEHDGTTEPRTPPFDRNDLRDPADRAAGIYHWNPPIRDHADRRQQLEWQLADLDDLNTEHAEVRAALRASYGRWIREIGVDAFRVDTAIHVPPEFFEDFVHNDDPAHPGMRNVAEAAGKPDFFLFGEAFGVDLPYEDKVARKLETYTRSENGRPRLPAMINFPLYGTLGDVFARHHPTGELAHRIESMMRVHADPWRMPSFVDNHDVDRFLAGGDEAGLKQALLAIMTLPGIPTIYYGTEQGYVDQRASMFAGGYGSGGRDRFDTTAPLYRYLAQITALRRAHRVFSRGTPQVLAANPAAPGAIAWRMNTADASALVVFNTADHPSLLDNLDTRLPAGTRLRPLYGLDADPPALTLTGAALNLILPPRSAMIWSVETGTAPSSESIPDRNAQALARPLRTPTLDPAPSAVDGDLALSGQVAAVTKSAHRSGTHGAAIPGSLRIVVDGDLASAQTVQVDANGRWRARLRTDDMIDPNIVHRVVAWDPVSATASAPHTFTVARAWTPVASVDDPAGDDTGPNGRYLYPDGEGWRLHRPGDLRGAELSRSGDALRLRLRLSSLVSEWNPLLGFDHVAFTVFIELPGRDDGAVALPQQNANLPEGMRWHLRLRSFGWSNAMFTSEGASASADGATAGTAARLDVDREAHTIAWTLPARAFGGADLAGARLYVTTWDYDGGFRPLAPEASGNTFGGGAANDPKIMDSVSIRIPENATTTR